LEERIPSNHPLRGVRPLIDEVLKEMSEDFAGLYSKVGRPARPPSRPLARLFRALRLQVF
jgi:hypothetical protein